MDRVLPCACGDSRVRGVRVPHLRVFPPQVSGKTKTNCFEKNFRGLEFGPVAVQRVRRHAHFPAFSQKSAERRNRHHAVSRSPNVVQRRPGWFVDGAFHLFEVPRARRHAFPGFAKKKNNLPRLVPPRHRAAVLLARVSQHNRHWAVVRHDELRGARGDVFLLLSSVGDWEKKRVRSRRKWRRL